MELRKRRPTVSFDDPDSHEAQAAAACIATGPAGDPERDNLLRLVETLPANQQQAVRLFYLEDRSYEAVAEVLGMPLGTVKNLLFRARKKLVELARPEKRWRLHEHRPRLREPRALRGIRVRARRVDRRRARTGPRRHAVRRHLRRLRALPRVRTTAARGGRIARRRLCLACSSRRISRHGSQARIAQVSPIAEPPSRRGPGRSRNTARAMTCAAPRARAGARR